MRQIIIRLSLSLCMSLTFIVCSFGQEADKILVKNYKPVSIYHTPVTVVTKAAFPAIDMHSHNDTEGPQVDVDKWVKIMDSMGIDKSVVLTYQTGKSFDSIVDRYTRYPNRFIFYCAFDYTGFGTPGWKQHALAELERCHKKGARGVGELGDKGEGEVYSKPTPGLGIHIDNPALQPLLQKCAELKMPISIHVAEDQWMYENADSANDGLMNSAEWHVNMNKPGKLNHDQLIAGLENAVRENPKTTFVACHLANSCSNLGALGQLFDKYPNLYADIAARFGEISPVPKYTNAFLTKYQDRIVYGTDMGPTTKMYKITFHILETADEHFYEVDQFGYRWALYGLNLPKNVLKKLYKTNAEKILGL